MSLTNCFEIPSPLRGTHFSTPLRVGGSGRGGEVGRVMTGITVFSVAQDKIALVTDYWPEPYEPPQRVSSFLKRRVSRSARMFEAIRSSDRVSNSRK